MKLNKILILAAALCAVAAVSQDKPQTRRHSVIILQARNFYWSNGNQAPYTWGGYSVFNVDASMDLRTNNAPLPSYLTTPILTDPYSVNSDWTNSLAVRTAEILDAGYRQTGQSGDGYSLSVTFTK
jgi:hypothetical protein